MAKYIESVVQRGEAMQSPASLQPGIDGFRAAYSQLYDL